MLTGLDSLAYFATSLNVTLYARTLLALDDVQAGTLYGNWGLAIAAWSLLAGPAVDRWGVRASLLAAALLSLLGRVLLAGALHAAHLYVALYALQAAGTALSMTALTIAVPLTLDNNTAPRRATAFGLVYVVSNVAALCADLLTDAMPLRTLLWMPVIATLLFLLLLPAFVPTPEPKQHRHIEPSFADVARDALRSRAYWQLVAFTVLLFGPRSVFRFVDSVLPLWMQRTMGAHAAYGRVSAINPAMIMVLVPLLQPRLAARDAYYCIAAGAALSALSPLALALWRPASYSSVSLFMVLLSAGEAVYSPRVADYVLQRSPRGREGAYAALLALPGFAVKALSGPLGGHLLADWCPRSNARDCYALWNIATAVACSGPVVLFSFAHWLRGGGNTETA